MRPIREVVDDHQIRLRAPRSCAPRSHRGRSDRRSASRAVRPAAPSTVCSASASWQIVRVRGKQHRQVCPAAGAARSGGRDVRGRRIASLHLVQRRASASVRQRMRWPVPMRFDASTRKTARYDKCRPSMKASAASTPIGGTAPARQVFDASRERGCGQLAQLAGIGSQRCELARQERRDVDEPVRRKGRDRSRQLPLGAGRHFEAKEAS